VKSIKKTGLPSAAGALLLMALLSALAWSATSSPFSSGNRLGNAGLSYYVSNSGSDSNNGLTPATAWQTIARVNSQTFAAKATVLFKGGQTFIGGIVLTTSHTPGPITIGSYKSGKATISSGNSTACVTATNIPSVTINDIACIGGGNTSGTTSGISIANSLSGDVSLAGPTVTNVTVSGYGVNGIEVKGTNGNSGFNGVNISYDSVHDVTGNSAPLTSCIYVYSNVSAHAHSNVVVAHNTVYSCTGKAGQSNWTGSGITLDAVNGGLMEYNVAHDFGAANTNCGGPVGIWAYESNKITIQYNEAYNGMAGSGGCDGGGFDLDGGETNSIMQYNYSHNNVGNGYLVDGFTGGNNSGSVVRFNISQNDGANTSKSAGIQVEADGTSTTAGCYVYNNTVYTNVGKDFISNSAGDGIACTISNNIFYTLQPGGINTAVTTPSNFTFTGNDYYGGTYLWNGIGYSTFAAWQAASGQEKIGGSNVGHTAEPMLVVYGGGGTVAGYTPANLNEYQLQTGSPMLDAGLNLNIKYGLTLPATDYYGASLSAGALPIGAGQRVAWNSSSSWSCLEASTFYERTSSPPVSTQEQYNALICGLVADGTWSTLDALYKFATDSVADAKLNLVSTSYGITAHSTIKFTANRGYAGDGSSGYLDTGFNPSTAAGHFALNSAEFGIFDNSHRSAAQSAFQMAAADGTNLTAICTVCALGSNGLAVWVNEAGGFNNGFADSSAAGVWIAQRTGASVESSYLDAAMHGSSTNPSSALPNADFEIGGLGGIGGFTSDQFSYAFFGGSLTSAQIVFLTFRLFADARAAGI
jgi:hypothetical protein